MYEDLSDDLFVNTFFNVDSNFVNKNNVCNEFIDNVNNFYKINSKINIDELGIFSYSKMMQNDICEIYDISKMVPKINYNVMGGRPSVCVEINKNKYECMLDTGAKISVLEFDLTKSMGKLKVNETKMDIRCANGSKIPIMGKTIINVKLGNIMKEIEFYVTKGVIPRMIGGINLLNEFDIRLKISESINSHEELAIIEIDKSDKTIDNEILFVIKEYDVIFMKHKWDVGKTELLKHEIKTMGDPIVINPRRQPVHMLNKIEENIKEMEINGIIKKCESPWNSPLVCIKKKNTEDIRICLDFRALNLITERPIFPIPSIEEMLDVLNGSKYFTTLDLGNAYYQVELDEESKIKTAFSTKFEQYCFNRMPFGIAAAPATFQKLMNKVLGELNWKEAVVYLDDILIFAKTKEEHIKRLRNVFQRIKESGLKLKKEKCQFLKKETKFLGHIINQDGIRTEDSKILAIKNYDRPKCIKQLRSFLGLTNYYRKFIENYTKYSKNLEKLCGSNQKKLVWTDECEIAFQSLKNSLISTPILAYPDFSKQFILDTDASFDRIGAVLSQKDSSGNEKVIAYGSKAMNAHELGYCITRKELLAIYYFTQHFKHYLYGKRFCIRTDHKAITFMLKTKKPITPQFQTWINHLSSMDIKLEYRKGELHNNADALSRNNCDTCVQCQTIHEEPKTGKLKTKVLAIMIGNNGLKWQENSEEIKEIKKIVEQKHCKDFSVDEEGIVRTTKDKIWIPKENVKEFLIHTHKSLCHAGVKKIINYVSQKFDMNSKQEIIQNIIQSCEECQKRKTLTVRTKETIIKQDLPEIFETILVDFCGPLKTTIHGKRYIIAIMDQYSRYISLHAVARQDERTTADIIRNKWILRFGAPRTIRCDRGKTFESNLIVELAKAHKIDIIYSSPYHHSANGLIERQFRTIRDAIQITLKDKKYQNWADAIVDVEFMMNSTIQNSTKYSPAEIVYGKRIYKEWLTTENNDKSIEKHILDQDSQRIKLRDEIQKNHKMINYDENKKTNRVFKIGENVLVKKDLKNKEDDRYEGPGEVIEKRHDRSYIIKMQDGKIKTRNVEWLKKFKEMK